MESAPFGGCSFSISGLRGRVGPELTPELVAVVARAFGLCVGPGRVAVGRDTRTSGPSLTAAVAAGLTSAGCDVACLGICPTPTVLHQVRAAGLSGGIVVTASHNPDEWNGLKFAGPDGRFLSPADFARFRSHALDPAPPVGWDRCGAVENLPGAVEAHVAAVAGHELFRPRAGRRLRVGVDAVNGAAAEAGPALSGAPATEPVTVNCATDRARLRRGFPRPPEPTPAHLAGLAELVRAERLDFGIGFDPDGDRAGLVDETGTALPEEWTLCLACRFLLALAPGPVVTNLSTTRAVESVAREFRLPGGGPVPVLRTPVGEAAVVAAMDSVGASVGGEGNGGVILPALNFTRDGLVALACIIGLIRRQDRPLSGLAEGLGEWRMARAKVDMDRAGFGARAEALVAAFPGAKPDRQDGIRVEGEDFWLHARPSNTEPTVRVIAEARGREPVPELELARAALTGRESGRRTCVE